MKFIQLTVFESEIRRLNINTKNLSSANNNDFSLLKNFFFIQLKFCAKIAVLEKSDHLQK